jgi:hypothetical protein
MPSHPVLDRIRLTSLRRRSIALEHALPVIRVQAIEPAQPFSSSGFFPGSPARSVLKIRIHVRPVEPDHDRSMVRHQAEACLALLKLALNPPALRGIVQFEKQ